jgi:hypothetical protein
VAAGRDDNDLYIWEEVPKEKTPEGPNGGGNDNGGDNNGDGDDGGDDGGDPGDDDPFQDASDVLCGLPSLHLGALRIGR